MENQNLSIEPNTIISTSEATLTGQEPGYELLELRMSPKMRRAKECAECILARPTFANERPGFTAGDIRRCTNLDLMTIHDGMEKFVAKNWLTKEEAAPTFLQSTSTLPRIYRAVEREDGQHLFTPKTKAGCQRSVGQYTLELLTPQQGQLLSSLAHLILKKEDMGRTVTQAELRAVNPDLALDAVSGIFRTLCRTSILEIIKRRENDRGGIRGGRGFALYRSTDRGMWLLEQVHLASKQIQPQASQPRPVKESEERKNKQRAVTVNDIHARLVERVQANYTKNAHGIVIQTITDNLNLKVLQGGVRSRGCVGFTESEVLQFNPIALHHLGPKGSFAVAHFLRLDPLLNGRWRPAADVERTIQAPAGVRLADFVKERYYRPLLNILKSLD